MPSPTQQRPCRARRTLATLALGTALALSLLASRAHAQCTEAWSQAPLLQSRGNQGMAYDSDRARVVMFGGSRSDTDQNDTWEWTGLAWTFRSAPPAPAPTARSGVAIAYDPIRQRTVLFGGESGSFASLFGDTWEWDGTVWTQMATTGPAPRAYTAAAFDASRGHVVLYGGFTGAAGFGDTWEWTGSAWNLIAASGPPARGGHTIAYDAAHTRLVMFGGFDGSVALGDTWQFAAGGWTQVTTPAAPAARLTHGMVYDSVHSRVVLFGGQDGSGDTSTRLGDTWELNGSAWVQRATTGPAPTSGVGLAFEASHGRTLLYGGEGNNQSHGQTWAWDGSTWTMLSAASNPAERVNAAMAYDADKGVSLLFGGNVDGATAADTWTWNGQAWTLHSAAGPAPRQGHAMAYDSLRRRTVMCGGFNDTNAPQDTWEWTGTEWVYGGTCPDNANYPAMAFDPSHARTVMLDQSGQTWLWDGAAWSMAANSGPSTRSQAAMAYDPIRGRIVLFGGAGSPGGSLLNDTWEWNGSAWTQLASSGPTPRDQHLMAFDASRGRVVLFGGYDGTNGLADLWEWTGTAWNSVSITGAGARFGPAGDYDLSRDRLVLFSGGEFFNGSIYFSTLSDTWELGAPGDPVITQGPAPEALTDGSALNLSVAASGGTLSYHWRKDGAPLNDGPSAGGGVTTGATGPVLAISPAHTADSGQYDCIVSNACAPATSTGAAVSITPACGSADFNCDGDTATDADIEAFFACLAGNCPPPPCMSTADFNGDGDSATDADIEAFFRVLAGGSC